MRRTAILRLNLATLDLAMVRLGRPRAVMSVPIEDGFEPTIREIAAEARALGARRAVLALGPGRVQIRRLDSMPGVPRRKLKAILERQPFRYFRPTSSELVTDATWVKSGKAPKKAALLAAADCELVDACVGTIEGCGLAVTRVTLVSDRDLGGERGLPSGECRAINLMSKHERIKRRNREARRAAFLAVLLLLTWLALGSWKLWRLQAQQAAASRRLESLEAATRSVSAARREVEHAALAVAVIDSVAAERARAVRLLADVVAYLPMDSYLTALTIDRDTLRASGFTSSPAALMRSISRQPNLSSAQLQPPGVQTTVGARINAPVTDANRKSRFELVAGVRSQR